MYFAPLFQKLKFPMTFHYDPMSGYELLNKTIKVLKFEVIFPATGYDLFTLILYREERKSFLF
jgi:hypothetical protein